jgi:hypothetical protein
LPPVKSVIEPNEISETINRHYGKTNFRFRLFVRKDCLTQVRKEGLKSKHLVNSS